MREPHSFSAQIANHSTPYHEYAENLVEVIGTEHFGLGLFEMFNAILDVKQCTAFTYDDRGARTAVAIGKTHEATHHAVNLATDYVGGWFAEDPNFMRTHDLSPGESILYSLRTSELQCGDDYRTRFYDCGRVAHELVFLKKTERQSLYVGLYRDENSRRFSDGEIALIRSLMGLTTKAVIRHQQIMRRPASDPASSGRAIDLVPYLQDVFLKEAGSITPREAEIIARISVGYSAQSIAEELQISPNTVATHRKRAYFKLRVCSQNELFTRYISSIIKAAGNLAC